MADHAGEHESVVESVMDKINDKLHHDSSSSDSEDEKEKISPVEAVKAKIYRLFGREKPVHKVLGGGKRTSLKSLSLSKSLLFSFFNIDVYKDICDTVCPLIQNAFSLYLKISLRFSEFELL